MKLAFAAFTLFFSISAHAATPDIAIPDADIALIKTTDYIEVSGTNSNGQQEDFTIHNAKAIAQFVGLLTSPRYNPVPKSLKPDFKSKSRFTVRLSSHGQPVLELQVIAESVLDLPNDPMFYMESDEHSDLLMAPLRRLR